jgi:hypothetical protein
MVRQTSLSGGGTTIALAGAPVRPYRAFSSIMSTGDTAHVMVVDRKSGEWQAATYSYDADSDALTFVTLLESSTQAQIDFLPGPKDVSISPLYQDLATMSAASTSSVEIGTGAKVFATAKAANFETGSYVQIPAVSDPLTHSMYGLVTSNADGNLHVDVQTASGSGTHNAWKILRASVRGGTGASGAPGSSRMTTMRLATTEHIPIDSLVNGATVDGRVVVTGNDVLVGLHPLGWPNGPYRINATGPATRHPDFQTYDAHVGATFYISDGDLRGNTVMACVSPPGGTLDSTDLDFVHFGEPKSQVLFRDNAVNADGKILVPELVFREKESGQYVLAQPYDGAGYWTEVDASMTDGIARRLYFDPRLFRAGTNPIVLGTGSSLPLSPSWQRIELGQVLNGNVKSSLPFVGGPDGLGVAANQFLEGNDPDHCSAISAGGVIVDVVDATLNALNITRGVQGSLLYSAYGLETDRAQGDEFIGAKFYVLADNDDASFDFFSGDGGAGAWNYRYGGQQSGYRAKLEKIHHARLRSYVLFTQQKDYDVNRWMIGVRRDTTDTSKYTVCGEQFAIRRHGAIGWIGRTDHMGYRSGGMYRGTLPVPLMSRDLYLVDGREQSIFLPNIIPLPETYPRLMADLSFAESAGATGTAYELTDNYRFRLDTTRIADGTTADLLMTLDRQARDWQFHMPINVHKVAGSGLGKSPKVLVIGDSIPNRSLLKMVDDRLTVMGVTTTWVGSIRTSTVDGDPADASGPFGECRESRGLGGLLNMTSSCTPSAPLVPGQEAAYIAADKLTKVSINPWVRPENVGVDDPSIVQNGQVFDFGYGIDRLSAMSSVVMPDIVIIPLGTNDRTDDTNATIVTNFTFAVPRICDSILLAKPKMRIVFTIPGCWGESRMSSEARQTWYRAIVTMIALVNGYGSSRVTLLASWAHMSPFADYAKAASPAVDPLTGYRWVATIDPRHPLGGTLIQLADSFAACIACLASMPDDG